MDGYSREAYAAEFVNGASGGGLRKMPPLKTADPRLNLKPDNFTGRHSPADMLPLKKQRLRIKRSSAPDFPNLRQDLPKICSARSAAMGMRKRSPW